jgi:hypothetical protein
MISLTPGFLLAIHAGLGAHPIAVVPVEEAARWFDLGHRIVAQIARLRLQPHTVLAVNDILGGQSLEDASIWADRIRGQRRNTSPLHFVNIPLAANSYVPTRDCPKGRCIIAAIDSFVRTLADSNASRPERAEALRFVLHLVADLHQPLHVADNLDRGGNRTQVRFRGLGTNLHKVWDGELVEHTGIGEREYLGQLHAAMDTLPVAKLEGGSVADWAMEGHRLAREIAYRVPPNRQLDGRYAKTSLPRVDLALIKAGVRLARLLNSALAQYQPHRRELGSLPVGTYRDEEAAAHVGEFATVVGTVVSVRTSRAGNIFVNFGADYPHQSFSAVLFRRQHPRSQELDSLEGRRVGIRGVIGLYKGQPQIVVETAEQILSMH